MKGTSHKRYSDLNKRARASSNSKKGGRRCKTLNNAVINCSQDEKIRKLGVNSYKTKRLGLMIEDR